MCSVTTKLKCAITCVYAYIVIWNIVLISSTYLHTCLNTTTGIRGTMSWQKCQEQCLLIDTCTGVSFCRRYGVCHMVTVSMETDDVVNNKCPGCVTIYRQDIPRDFQQNDNSTSIVGCDVNTPDFIDCQIKGNMYHFRHRIQVICNILYHNCRNTTFVCGFNGVWTFEKCLLKIPATEITCVSDATVLTTVPYINVALGKNVTMSSLWGVISPASLMVDGVRNPHWPCASTRGERNPYMVIDLDNMYTIYSLYILNRRLVVTCVSDATVLTTVPYINVALGKNVTMSSLWGVISPASLMVDGIRNLYWPCACTHREMDPYMIIDLVNMYTIYSLYILNRFRVAYRLRDFEISFGRSVSTLSPRLHQTGALGNECTVSIYPPVEARYVRIQIIGTEILTICEFEIYGFIE